MQFRPYKHFHISRQRNVVHLGCFINKMPYCSYLAFGDYFLREAVIMQLINYSNNHNFFSNKKPLFPFINYIAGR